MAIPMSGSNKIGTAYVELLADLDGLKADYKKALDQTKRYTQKQNSLLNKASKRVAAFFAGFASVAAARGIFRGFATTIEQLDRLAKTSEKLGVTTRFLQEMTFAAEQSGVRFEQLQMGMQRFTRRVSEAANGMGEARDAVKELDLNLTDANGTVRRTEDLFREALAAIAGVENQADKLRLTFKLFDSEGVSIVQMTDNYEELIMKAREYGLIIDDVVIRKSEEAKDAFHLFGRQTDSLAASFTYLATQIAEGTGIPKALSDMTGWIDKTFKSLMILMHGVEDFYAMETERSQSSTQDAPNKRLDLYNEKLAFSIEQLKERIRVLKEEPLNYDLLLQKQSAINDAKASGVAQTKEELETLIQQHQVLESLKATEEALIEAQEKRAKQAQKLAKEAAKQQKQLSRELSEAFLHFGDDISGALADMAVDGKISFKELGRAFIKDFIEVAIRGLVRFMLMKAIAGIANAFGTGASSVSNPSVSLGTFDSDNASLIDSALPQTPTVNVINNTGQPSSVGISAMGNVEAVIGNTTAGGIVNGGPVDNALQAEYGLSRTGKRGN